MSKFCRHFLPVLLCILVISSCKKTADSPIEPPPIDPLEAKVTASIDGRVTDENGNPVNNALVKSGNTTTSTDINGMFRFSNIQLNKNAGFVLVEKEGYLNGSRTIFTTPGTVNHVQIQLIPRVVRGQFSATSGGTLLLQNEVELNFPANAIINTATNQAYTGTVKVTGAYLNPTDPNLPLIMPGNLTGLDKNNEQKLLKTYGMVAVELIGDNQEKLNIATGKEVNITMPIPSLLQSTAPSTVPLWFFDESKGIWVEEGVATKTNIKYSGKVKHFTFWNIDTPAELTDVRLTLKNPANQALASHRVDIKSLFDGSIFRGYTDSAGAIQLPAPLNSSLELTIYNKCNNLIYTQNISPLSDSINLGVITVVSAPIVNITVSGSVFNCNLNPITSGYAEIQVEGGIYRAAIQNGNFSITTSRCGTTGTPLKYFAFDSQNGQFSDTTQITVTSGNYQTGSISTCGTTSSQYIYMDIEGRVVNHTTPPDIINVYKNGNETRFELASNNVFGTTSQIIVEGVNGVGTFVIRNFNIGFSWFSYGSMNLVVTEYSGGGQILKGTINGRVRDGINAVPIYNLTGTFSVIRH